MKKKQTGEFLKFSGFYVWFLIVPLTAVTLLFKWKNGFLRWVSTFLYGGTCAFLIHIEWIYLAMNGRFPQRVEESIRLLMLSVGFMIVCHLLSFERYFIYPYFCCYSMYFTGSYFTYGSKWK